MTATEVGAWTGLPLDLPPGQHPFDWYIQTLTALLGERKAAAYLGVNRPETARPHQPVRSMITVQLPDIEPAGDAVTWFTAPGWTTAHELRPNGLETLCGWPLNPDQRIPAPDGMRFCGQCRRRLP